MPDTNRPVDGLNHTPPKSLVQPVAERGCQNGDDLSRYLGAKERKADDHDGNDRVVPRK